jgi:hypothetical protein
MRVSVRVRVLVPLGVIPLGSALVHRWTGGVGDWVTS